MGAGCTKEDAALVIQTDGQDQNGGPLKDGFDSAFTQQNGHKATNNGETESLSSNTSSRPPTPFSRPLTAAVIARPKTTTIYESDTPDQEGGEEGEENPDINGQEATNGHEVNILNVEDQHMEHLRALRRDHSRSSLENDGHGRRLSNKMLGDEDDIQKIKEYMEKKGL